ncbi:fucose 4-O-acetylase, partial [Photobacterium iliopiscarium]
IFMQAPLFNDQPLLGMGLNQVSRFAVPLFFIMAGYFFLTPLITKLLPFLLWFVPPFTILRVYRSYFFFIFLFK